MWDTQALNRQEHIHGRGCWRGSGNGQWAESCLHTGPRSTRATENPGVQTAAVNGDGAFLSWTFCLSWGEHLPLANNKNTMSRRQKFYAEKYYEAKKAKGYPTKFQEDVQEGCSGSNLQV